MLKNSKLEQRIQDMDVIRRENHELKAQREKQQNEVKAIYEDKQRLFEDIMKLKDQLSAARSETKEKLMSI